QIQQIDPLYINIKQPAGEMLKIKKMILAELSEPQSSEQILQARSIAVKVFLDDGTPYEHDGKLLFADVSVDAATGEASLRATLPNPKHLLMPGLYVRVEVPQVKVDNAVLIPQQAVTRGKTDTVYVLNADNSFVPRPVTIMQSQGNQWLITDGLNAGDKVIVDGMQLVMMMHAKQVTPVPWEGNQAP
ncbi:MAG: efflux transporter periplasmic adaptor subunit, partial [Gammaproteobacteria bacterium]